MSAGQSSDDAVKLRLSDETDETVGQVQALGARPEIAPASSIGRYVILDLLGVGGMGVVCTAYDPKLDRKVALKLLRDGGAEGESHASQGRARLLREAQALAKLSHPNIITVHDVDTFDGQLYISMEYVEGRTIKEWLQAEAHPWREIVDVFVDAGRGLAAAHAAGITHRDFKPANVLIGDDGRVRVLDFGLAKGGEERELELEIERTTGRQSSMAQFDSGIIDMMRSASSSELTQIGHSVGTPAYMAPEQHMGFGVGPHTDQFSFCVALFEALDGALPFEGHSLEERFQNMVEGNLKEPSKDSQAPAWVHRVLQRGLRSQAADRYPDMNQLLAQLSRDPAKRRRRIALVAGLVCVAGFGAFGAYQMNATANDVCQGAQSRLADVWDDDRRATVHAAFAATNKPYAEDAWTRVASTLDDYTTRWVGLHTEVCTATHVRGDQSEALLDVRMACLARRLADVDALVDIYAEADDQVVVKAASSVDSLQGIEDCGEAQALPEKQALPKDPVLREQVERLQRDLAVVEARLATGQLKELVPLAQAAADRATELPHLPTRAEAFLELARAHKGAGDPKAAEEMLRQTVRTAAEAGDAKTEAEAWSNLVHVVGYTQRRGDEGLAWVLPAEAAIARVDDPIRLRQALLNNVASIHFGQGDYEKAEQMYREALSILVELYGADSPRTTGALGNLVSSLGAQGKYEEAEPLARQTVELARVRLGDNHPDLAGDLINHGHVLTRLGRDEDARASYEQALAIRQRVLPAEHPKIGDALSAVAGVYRREGKLDESRDHFAQALAIYRKALEPDHPTLALALNNIGSLERSNGQFAEALAHHREALEVAQQRLKADHPNIAATRRHICASLRDLGRNEEALEECRRSLSIYEANDDAKQIAGGLHQEALVLVALGRESDAEDRLRRALARLANSEGRDAAIAGAGARQLLAEVLWSIRARRVESLELAIFARDVFAREGEAESLRSVESWLQDHRLP